VCSVVVVLPPFFREVCIRAKGGNVRMKWRDLGPYSARCAGS